MKKEVNTSLSARIKKRNRVGFKGEGTQGKWVKKTLYGKWNEKEIVSPFGEGYPEHLSVRETDKRREVGKNSKRGGRGRSHKNVKYM